MFSMRFRPALVVGGVGIAALVALMVYSQFDGRERHLYWLVGVLPAIPALIALLGMRVAYRGMDERERRIHDEALRNAFLWSALTFFGYGLLQVFAGFPALNFALAAAVMLCIWGVAYLIAVRRY